MLWLRSLLWHRFDPWPGKFCISQAKKEEEEEEEEEEGEEGEEEEEESGVPILAQWLTNPTRNHEVEGSIPGLAQCVKDLVLP